jgi:multidrug efflux pump subunit AcrB
MTAEEHNKTLATLHFIYGAMHGLTLLGLLLLVFVFMMSSQAANLISTFWIVITAVVFVVLLLAVGLLPLLVGYGLWKRRRWAKPLGVSLAIISLINIPIGTALGIYTFKFFRSEGGIKLYGGKASTVKERELQDAARGAQPLMKWADRLK